MTPVRRRQLKNLSLGFVYGMVGSLAFMRFFRGRPAIDRGDLMTAIFISLFMTVGMTIMFGEIVPRTRRWRLLPAVTVRSIVCFLATEGAVLAGVVLANFFDNGYSKGIARLERSFRPMSLFSAPSMLC